MDDRCIRGLDALPDALRGCALSIGNFDGVHRGHQRIIATARQLAQPRSAAVVAMTFEPAPDQVLRPDSIAKRITPAEAKVRLLRQAGADAVVLVTADKEFLSMTPRQFIDDVLVGRFAPSHIVEGPNFFFGRGRSGNTDTLREAGPAAGFETHVVEPVMIELDGQTQRVSSTLIRTLVEAGRVEDACQCLGHEFALYGQVVKGTGRGGKLLGFPTVNISPGGQVVPADGIYAGRALIDGAETVAAVSIGHNPTLGGTSGRSIEAHLIDLSGDLYGRQMELRFVQRLRDQRKFDSPEALRAQIAEDVKRVRQIVG